MYIKRDMTLLLEQSPTLIQILIGPRQCGKSTLLATFLRNGDENKEITFDDFQMRQLANEDPALFLDQFSTPLLLDEIQYVPNLFPELKIKIDQIKRKRVHEKQSTQMSSTLYWLTGSNQILLDKNIKESLSGRASYYYLNTLSVHEILQTLPKTNLKDILFKGGWPECYTNPNLSVTTYLNNYIRTYVEKDIMTSAGIHKITEFMKVLRLCASRTSQETDYSDIQKDSGVSSVTVKEWISVLERADLIYQLKPYFNNLNKRLIKRPKLYFLDTGLAARLQGWSESLPLLNSPQVGGLFETLVLAEIVKFIRNYGKDWEIFFARTKDGQEIDFIIKTADGRAYSIESKFSISGISKKMDYPPALKKEFNFKFPLLIVTAGGKKLKLSSNCIALPIAMLHDYLQEI